ncbi:bifunctional diguanylate cyclase/phosphodiesterase [Geomonas azotofigens]|uniref:bifunctional diguanylate cyclase/phosphodiesterase n=1 Tax=Geomonas azotofigens TaxID=2843196 RepID=UPI001C126E46|nr:EAL domain-containing protein [Geomonas azotofigens]MBU5615327.1 EAL domain-containing protein [Geomonas azotofigens]
MTLYRQLIIFTVVLFLLLFTGTWYAKLANTRTFLTNQLESHVQDTATSLALSISPHVAQKDLTVVEGMISALFDRGYYQKITYSDPRGKVLIERTLPVRVEDVPQWFVALVPVKTPEAISDVMAGWNQGGSILVKSHPGYAYATLWSEVISMTVWFAACAAFLLLAAGIGLRILLKPLVAVERQADALCRKEYQLQESLPRTREFKSVVEAMNRMTVKVKEMFEEQAARAEGLQERAYQDPVTQLGNRRFFESQVNADLGRQDQNGCGLLVLVRIHGLEALNQKKGLQAGDDLLKRVASLLKSSLNAYADTALSRLTGGDFGIFLPNASASEGGLIATDIAAQFGRVAMEKIALTDNIGHLGIATYQGSTTLTRLLAEADLALSAALQKGANSWELRAVTGETETLPQGQQHWKDALVRALDERRITLDAQGVIENGPGRKVVQLELFARIMEQDGKALDAALFMPVAERLKLVSSIDRMVIEEALKVDYRRLGVERVAINLSPTSLEDVAFRNWLYAFLKALPAGAPHVSFEFSEFAAVQHLVNIREFGAAVRECGHGIGLDHYGRSFSKLGYLQSLHPEYVKIDRAYTGELSGGENDSRFYVASLCSVAHSIDIKVVAEGVESEEQAAILKELNLDGMQGYFFGRPQPLSSYPALR